MLHRRAHPPRMRTPHHRSPQRTSRRVTPSATTPAPQQSHHAPSVHLPPPYHHPALTLPTHTVTSDHLSHARYSSSKDSSSSKPGGRKKSSSPTKGTASDGAADVPRSPDRNKGNGASRATPALCSAEGSMSTWRLLSQASTAEEGNGVSAVPPALRSGRMCSRRALRSMRRRERAYRPAGTARASACRVERGWAGRGLRLSSTAAISSTSSATRSRSNSSGKKRAMRIRNEAANAAQTSACELNPLTSTHACNVSRGAGWPSTAGGVSDCGTARVAPLTCRPRRTKSTHRAALCIALNANARLSSLIASTSDTECTPRKSCELMNSSAS